MEKITKLNKKKKISLCLWSYRTMVRRFEERESRIMASRLWVFPVVFSFLPLLRVFLFILLKNNEKRETRGERQAIYFSSYLSYTKATSIIGIIRRQCFTQLYAWHHARFTPVASKSQANLRKIEAKIACSLHWRYAWTSQKPSLK